MNIWVTSFTGDIFKIAGFSTFLKVDEQNSSISDNNDFIETKVYPNPVSDFSTISFKLTGKQGNLVVRLFDMMGRELIKMYDKNLDSNQPDYCYLDVKDLPSGVYNLVFSLDSGTLISRPVVVVK